MQVRINLNILSLYYTHKPGGLCARLYRLLAALADQAHSVTYLCLDQPPANFPSNVQVILIPFPPIPRRGVLFWLLFSLWCPIYLLVQVIVLKPDRVVVFNPYYALICGLSKIFYPLRIVLFLRASSQVIAKIRQENLFRRMAIALIERVALFSADTVVVMTKSMLKQIKAKLRSKTLIFELPNDLPKLAKSERASSRKLLSQLIGVPINNEDFILATLGVIDKRKNVQFLLELKGALQNLEIECRTLLIIAGSGSELDQLKEFVIKHALSDVYFIGWQDKAWDVLSGVDLYLHPSLHEGVSNSVLEALALKIPLLLSDIPEQRELVGSDDQQLFSLDKPQVLAQRLAHLSKVDSPSLAKIVSLNQALASKLAFDWDERALRAVIA